MAEERELSQETSQAWQSNLGSTEEARITANINNWKRKLLDVTKRNRALNFKPNKVTTVTIVDEQPAEVFRQLYIQGRAMRFRPTVEKNTGSERIASESSQAANAFEEIAIEDTPALDFVPYETSSLDEHYTDDILQTASLPDKLDQSLRRIDEQARTSLEEQGVNTLFLALGMLHYKESPDSEEVFRAPLLLLPVKLSRKNARTGYVVQAEEDPIVNPALVENLRRSFGIVMPDLPDLTSLPEDYDLQQFFIEVNSAIANQKGWQVKRDMSLAFFSFQKFIMYKDLEVNSAAFSTHPLVRQIILRSGASIRALPDEIRTVELDREFAPETTSQVTNADSSQLRAILAVDRNHDLVIEGPPGTGKSQTITNLIAQALSKNKSILFVAEKMAALEVVYSRLVDAGLGEFCLELHSTKANKRAVMKEVGLALDASLQRPPAVEAATERIHTVRSELTAYAEALHAPFGAIGLSPYGGYGELERVLHAPKVKFTAPVETITREQFINVERDLHDLSEAAQLVGIPAQHPWRDTTRTFYSEQDLDQTKEVLTSLHKRLARIKTLTVQAQQDFMLPPITGFADVHLAAKVAEVLSQSPGAPLAVLQNDAWNSPPRQATELVERGRKLKQLRQHIDQRFRPEVLEQDHTEDIAFIETKESGVFRFLNFLNGRFRAIKNRWLAYRLPNFQASLLEQASEMRKVDALRREREAITALSTEAEQLFGRLWQGEYSDWDALNRYIYWVKDFRTICVTAGIKEQAIIAATHPQPDFSYIKSLKSEVDAITTELRDLCAHVRYPTDYFKAATFEEISERIESLYQNLHLAPRWAAFEQVKSKVASGLASEILEPAMRDEIAFVDLASAFKRAFFQRWLNEALSKREPLRNFNSLTHEQRVREFKRLDEQVLGENRLNLVRYLRNRVQERLRTKEAIDALPFLRRQLTLQRGLSPLRTTFQKSLPAIRAIKPVFLMSPLSVSQLLDGKQPSFDLVIFDEASQLPTEDAVGAIGRGKQLVVVGDPKQLPPTNFFSVMSGTVSAPIADDGTPLFEDSQSVLEEFMGSGASMARLKWHYRSAHESLINFSNVSFYDAELYTFPSVETDSHATGLSFEYVMDGVYEGKGLNLIEARRVADAVVRHAKTNPEMTLGVGTFNLRQQIAIQDELELRRRQDPSLEPFFVRSKKEPFFVKNLENIQGDERDVILLSVTYARNSDGVMRYNFGPLNGENGWRRLNVLITRARKSMRVFSSIKGEDINPIQAASQGPHLLRDFLLYAEHGRITKTSINPVADTESPFEREVYLELTRRGLKLQPQVGVAGYRIDLGVIDELLPGRYLCGIECDGATYHSSEAARDRDRLRQQVLEARGWTIHRLWSTDWFKDRNGQIERVLGLIEQTKKEVQAEKEAEAEARTRWDSLQKEAQETNPNTDSQLIPGLNPDQALPAILPYTFAETPLRYKGQEFYLAATSQISAAINDVVKIEAPLHVKDLASRVVAFWGHGVVGPSMMRRVQAIVNEKSNMGEVVVRGDFVFKTDSSEIPIRFRAGTTIPAERIAPEEYKAAILLVLQIKNGLDRKSLVNNVRSVFGFNRTGTKLESAITSAIDELLVENRIGEGSTGIKLIK